MFSGPSAIDNRSSNLNSRCLKRGSRHGGPPSTLHEQLRIWVEIEPTQSCGCQDEDEGGTLILRLKYDPVD
jgi:hypothetical protein